MNGRCSFHQLSFQSADRYVLRCTQCDCIQIVFGNILLTFETNVFSDFRFLLDTIAADYKDLQTTQQQPIQVPMPYYCISILLTMTELEQLIMLLDTADTELQSQLLLQLFNPQA